MEKEEYIELYEKCASGNCTEEERRLLERYMDEFSLDKIPWDEASLGEERVLTGLMYKRLRESIHRVPKSRRIFPYWIAATAAVIVLLVLFLPQHDFVNVAKQPDVAERKDEGRDLLPGGNKAVLLLADGSEIVLDSLNNGVIANQQNIVIRKTKDGQLVYDVADSTVGTSEISDDQYNLIKIPRGGQYQLVLPDGTRVWLNAESSLKYPPGFIGKDRTVELSGEGYFEVSKNSKKPFKVIVNSVEVEVLGTHFNINAYDKEAIKTTLVEGAVRVKKGGMQVKLKPGQSGISSSDNAFMVETADMEEDLAWKNGYFIFSDESIYSIMEKVGRWYDFEVEYRGDMTGKLFWGKVSRYDNISELLKNLELTGIIHFEIEESPDGNNGHREKAERRVIVTP